MSNMRNEVSEGKLAWLLKNPASPALCVVHTCTALPVAASEPFCAGHKETVEALGKKNKPTTKTYRRNVWALVVTGNG